MDGDGGVEGEEGGAELLGVGGGDYQGRAAFENLAVCEGDGEAVGDGCCRCREHGFSRCHLFDFRYGKAAGMPELVDDELVAVDFIPYAKERNQAYDQAGC